MSGRKHKSNQEAGLGYFLKLESNRGQWSTKQDFLKKEPFLGIIIWNTQNGNIRPLYFFSTRTMASSAKHFGLHFELSLMLSS